MKQKATPTLKIKEDDVFIKVKEVIRSTVIGNAAHGKEVRQAMEKPLAKGKRVVLDLEGINGFSVVGAEAAFDWALDKYGDDLFEKSVILKGEYPEKAEKFLDSLYKTLGMKDKR